MMGLWDYLRRSREETQRIHDTGTSSAAPPTFVPELIKDKVWNRDDPGDQFKVARHDPIGYYITHKISENVFDDWFRFVDKDGNEIMFDVQKELRKLNARRIFTQVLAGERTFGHSWLYTGKAKFRDSTSFNGNRIANLDYFTPRMAEVVKYDGLGQPEELKIELSTDKGTRVFELPADDFILVRTRPYDRTHKGHPATYSVWDYLTYLRYIFHSISWYDMKIGLGIFVMRTKNQLSQQEMSNLQEAYQDISVKRSGVFDDRIEDVEFIGADAGGTNFHEDIAALLNMIAAGCGIPKDVLTGVSAGAITGSEINNKALYATLNQIQRSFEPVIRELVRRMGYDREFDIDWNTRYAHDEEEKARINYLNAQELGLKMQWMTINEIRAEEGLPPVENGDRLPSDVQVTLQGEEPSSDERSTEQTRNPEGVNT